MNVHRSAWDRVLAWAAPARHRSTTRSRKPAPKRINLALQGGGAHGAFTWGVLDRLLEDGRIDIDGISGTCAGAMNAVMLADGLARGGPDGGAHASRRILARGRAATAILPDLQRGVAGAAVSDFSPRAGRVATTRCRAWSRPM